MEENKIFTKKKIFIGVGTCFLIIIFSIYYALNWLHKAEHKECIKDKYGGKTLIEHYDIDTNIAKLEIRENGKSKWIKHPNCCMKNLGPLICGDRIEFDKSDNNKIIVNNKSFPIEFISEEEAKKLGREAANKMYQNILNK